MLDIAASIEKVPSYFYSTFATRQATRLRSPLNLLLVSPTRHNPPIGRWNRVAKRLIRIRSDIHVLRRRWQGMALVLII